MRVTGGEFGGRRLRTGRGRRARPTTDRVREALFSILGDLSGLRALDLYCGTGALGIEALSRGAAHSVFVDTDIRAARRNADELGLGERAELVRADALRFLQRAEPGSFDLVLIDPPYKLADRLGAELEPALRSCLAEEARVIVESSAREPLRLELPLLTERRYGDTLVRIHGAGL